MQFAHKMQNIVPPEMPESSDAFDTGQASCGAREMSARKQRSWKKVAHRSCDCADNALAAGVDFLHLRDLRGDCFCRLHNFVSAIAQGGKQQHRIADELDRDRFRRAAAQCIA